MQALTISSQKNVQITLFSGGIYTTMYTRVHAQLGNNDFKGLRYLRELIGPQFH